MEPDSSRHDGGLAPGDQIAGYQIEEQIGRGGMAVVYRALDLRLGRQVALKVLAPHLGADDAFRQRFIRESRAAAGVDHPHIVPVFDAGEAGDMLFIAMRYVGFGDVRALIESEGRLSMARATAITAQVASALDAAHAHGLIHRDVKPGNMLLAETGASGTDHVYLADFGLSKHSLSTTTLTAAGQFMGTLDYVSPEQIQGRPADGRADQYALACTAAEMLTGAPPFKRDESMALLWAQLEAPPPPLTGRRPDLPPAVDTVIRTALAKYPGDRYPTCLAFASALRAACDAAPITIRSAGQAAPATQTARAGPPQAGPRSPEPAGGTGRTRADPVPAMAAPGPEPAAALLTQRMPADGAAPAPTAPGRQEQLVRLPDRRPPQPRPGKRPPGPGAGPLRVEHLVPQGPQVRRRGRGRLVAGLLAVVALAGLAGLGYKLLHHPVRHGRPITYVTVPPPPTYPAKVVLAYFNAINARDYRTAWTLGGQNHGQTYKQFQAGYLGTAQDTITILSTSGNVVTARLTARQTDGTVKHFEGTYTVSNGMITATDVHRVSS